MEHNLRVEEASMTDRELLRHIERSAGQSVGYKQLVREFGLGGGRERRLLLEHLARLTAAGRLLKTDRERWTIAHVASTRDNLVAGRLDLHRDGFGFVRVTGKPGADKSSDIFIPPPEIGDAMAGDQVLVDVAPLRPGADPDRRQGRIVRVLTRRNPTIVGIFHYAKHRAEMGHKVVPFNEKLTQPILIPLDAPLPEPRASLRSPHRVLGEEAAHQIAEYPDLEGLVVDVEVTAWPTETRIARGRVVEVLGRQDDFGVDVEMVIRKHQLPRIFPGNVLEEARTVAELDPAVLADPEHFQRQDFRDRVIVTIDGETARDFDDAVEVRELSGGNWELDVHIADVAEYVQPASALDLEARLRGTSVYFPDRAIPMLPHELSTGICSLRPDEDRLVLSCRMQIDTRGEVAGFEIGEGIIRSARRMTYTQVAAVIEGNEAARGEFAPLVPHFEAMERLAQILNKKRERRGSIDFDLPEPSIEFDEHGAMQGVTRAKRNWAHRLIEEFMLAANESVASWLSEHAPALYRIHEKPDPKRIVDFEDVAANFGYSLGLGNLPVKRFAMKHEQRDQRRKSERGDRGRQSTHRGAHEVPDDLPVTPQMYQKLARRIAGKPEERILSYLMLRSLKQARYSEENDGHFALAASYYTHFTSPIRRYPDLIVHRIIKTLLRTGLRGVGIPRAGEPQQFHEGSASATDAVPVPTSELAAIASESSDTERRADGAERELVEWKKIRFMADKVGEEFDGLLLSITKYGLFVELNDLFVEGLVPIQALGALDGDRYTYRENTREIIGETWNRRFRMGQPVRVLLERVDAVEKRLLFALVPNEHEEANQPSRFAKLGKKAPAGKPAKAKKKKEKKRGSMQASTPKHRIPAPKGTGKNPKRKRP
jgi:ribonuclease R